MAVLEQSKAEEKARILKARQWISARLKNTATHVDFNGLYSVFVYTDITFVCKPPAGFEDGDWLVGKIRGAWGQQLFKRRALETRSPYVYRPHACDGLFHGHEVIGESPSAPPYVISITRRENLILINLRLFGMSNIWRDEAAFAMEEALNRGINFNENTHYKGGWKVLDKYYQCHAFAPKRPLPKDVFLYWDTPLRQGGRAHMIDSHIKLVEGLVGRIRLIARWCGVDLNFNDEAILADIQRIKGKVLPPKYISSHIRRSSRSPGKQFVMTGVLATTLLENVPNSIWPILDIGELCHAGSNTSFGFGKYKIG